MQILLIIIALMIIIAFNVKENFQYQDPDYIGRLINRGDYKSSVNPSPIIAPDVLQTGETGCGKLDYVNATPEQVTNYYTCLNQMKRVAIKKLTGLVGANP